MIGPSSMKRFETKLQVFHIFVFSVFFHEICRPFLRHLTRSKSFFTKKKTHCNLMTPPWNNIMKLLFHTILLPRLILAQRPSFSLENKKVFPSKNAWGFFCGTGCKNWFWDGGSLIEKRFFHTFSWNLWKYTRFWPISGRFE